MKKSKEISVVAKAILAAGLVGAGGLASAATTTEQLTSSQPTSSPGLTAGLLTTTGANTASTIGSTVGAITGSAGSGGLGTFSALPAGVTRLALPGQGGTGAAAASGVKPLNVWFAMSQNRISYDYAPLQSSGRVNVGLIGLDYTFGSNNMVAGLAIARDRTNVDLSFSGGKLRGRGTTYTPYLGIPLTKNFTADVSAGWGDNTVDTEVGGITGRSDGKRRTGSLGLSYRQSFADKWMLSGRGSYLAVKDKLGAYTLSNGTFVAGGDVKLSQLRLGGQAEYNADKFVPYAGLNYIYDLKAPNQAGAANDRDAFQAVLGVKFSVPSGLYGGLQYSSELDRSQVKNNQIMLNVGSRF